MNLKNRYSVPYCAEYMGEETGHTRGGKEYNDLGIDILVDRLLG